MAVGQQSRVLRYTMLLEAPDADSTLSQLHLQLILHAIPDFSLQRKRNNVVSHLLADVIRCVAGSKSGSGSGNTALIRQ